MANRRKRNNPLIKLAAGLFYILAAAVVLLAAYAEFNPKYIISTDLKLIYAGIITCSMILATRLTVSACRTINGKRRASRICVWVLFAYYCMILINMLFFDSYFHRGIISGDWRHFNKLDTNFKPFHTIKLYMQSYREGTLNHSIIATNLIGNLLAFAPMGLFLPVLCKRLGHIIPFISLVLVMVVSVELIQLFTGVGSCDVDDVILNFAGAFIIFLFCKLPFMQKWLRKMYLL